MRVIWRPKASEGLWPKILWAEAFQLIIMPLRSLEMIASSELATIEVRSWSPGRASVLLP